MNPTHRGRRFATAPDPTAGGRLPIHTICRHCGVEVKSATDTTGPHAPDCPRRAS